MKLRSLAAAVAAFSLGTGVALAQTAAAPPAAPAAAPADKTTLSYAIGYDMARDLADRKVDLDVTTIIRGIQDGYAKRDPAYPAEKLGAALQAFQQKMAADERARFEQLARDNNSKSTAFLTANRSKPGVTVLPTGIQYRIIEPGTGVKPTSASTIQLHLRGSISTGQEFANTYNTPGAQPAEVKMSEFPPILPPSVKDVLMMMPAGSRWEVFLPPEKAWGNDPRSPIGPGQAVVFDLKLVSVK